MTYAHWHVTFVSFFFLFLVTLAGGASAVSAASLELINQAPTVSLLEPQIFRREPGAPAVQDVEFDAPLPLHATLRVVNGAKIDPDPKQVVTGGAVFLNGSLILGPKDFQRKENVIEVPLALQQGDNILRVDLGSKPGSRLSAEIFILADKLELLPVANPVVIGGDPLEATAILTAQTLPVPDAEITFSVSGNVGNPAPISASTDENGTATASIGGFQTPGPATLTAEVIDTSLSADQPFQVVDKALVSLSLGVLGARLDKGTTSGLVLVVFYNGNSGSAQTVKLDPPIVTPSGGGLGVLADSPPEGWQPTEPTSFFVGVGLDGQTAGKYGVAFTAQVVETGDSWTINLPVEVVDPEASTLALGKPTIVPDNISVAKSTPVVFSADASGASPPPDAILLQQVTEDGVVVQELGELLDDGDNGDLSAGDGIYSREIAILGLDAEERLYRVTAVDKGQTVRSDRAALLLTSFAVGAAPLADFPPVEFGGQEFASDQVLAKFSSGYGEGDILDALLAVQGWIVGTVPPFRQVAIPGGGDPEAVITAVGELNKFAGVDALPNFTLDTGGGNDYSSEQWSAKSPYDSPTAEAAGVRAVESSIISRGNGQSVAVIDYPVQDHGELALRLTCFNPGSSTPVACPGAVGDVDDIERHGTKVAGIIAANRDTTGGNVYGGVASLAGINSYNAYAGSSFWSTVANLLGALNVASGQNNIINMSLWERRSGSNCDQLFAIPSGDQTTLNAAFTNNKFVVTIAGNHNANTTPFLCSQASTKPNAICVGGVNRSGGRWQCSGYNPAGGNKVEISAPAGTTDFSGGISTNPNDVRVMKDVSGYGWDRGTSFAAPHIAGAAAALLSYWQEKGGGSLPANWQTDLKARLIDSARAVSGSNIGPRLDVFEAIFNASFEYAGISPDNIPEWGINIGVPTVDRGICDNIVSNTQITAPRGADYALCSSGTLPGTTVPPGNDPARALLTKEFKIDWDVEDENVPISFQYNIVSEEHPEWTYWNSPFKDKVQITLEQYNGSAWVLPQTLVDVDVVTLDYPGNNNNYPQTNCFCCVSGAGWDFQGGDSTAGETGWVTRSAIISRPAAGGSTTYRLRVEVEDNGDRIYDTAVLLDDVQLKQRTQTPGNCPCRDQGRSACEAAYLPAGGAGGFANATSYAAWYAANPTASGQTLPSNNPPSTPFSLQKSLTAGPPRPY